MNTVTQKNDFRRGKFSLSSAKRLKIFPLLLAIIAIFALITPVLNAATFKTWASNTTDDSTGNIAADKGGITLIPGGIPFGVKIQTAGVLVVGISEITSLDGRKVSPCKSAGVREKDIIKSINGKSINTVDELTGAIASCGGNALKVKLERDGKTLDLSLLPVKGVDGAYKAGIWVRDSTAGIGTVTFIDPRTGAFAGLGHGICDADTGTLMPLLSGTVTDVKISSIVKGSAGAPGEIRGYLIDFDRGTLHGNTECGVYGTLNEVPKNIGEAFQVASANEIHTGDAKIICTLSDGNRAWYNISIDRINFDGGTKNFVVRVVDPTLLSITGGIVQGMSGSPIIQDGKLIGAVTHVMVNDPTSGYGIFIGNMMRTEARD